jgi:hypothetical protein
MGFVNEFLDMTPKAQATKSRLIGLCQNEKHLCIKEHYQQSEKATYGTRVITCKSRIR